MSSRVSRDTNLEECVAGVELEHDAADAPDVTRLRPAHLQYDFRRSIVARRHDGAVVLVVERRRAEVDELDVSAQHLFVVALLQNSSVSTASLLPSHESYETLAQTNAIELNFLRT